MSKGALVHRVLERFDGLMGSASGQTVYVRRWAAPGRVPVNVERRGSRAVLVWVPWPESSGPLPEFGELYDAGRPRNSNLSIPLKIGARVAALRTTDENINAVCKLVARARDVNVI